MLDTALNLLQFGLLGKAAWMWLLFFGVVVTLLIFDLGVLHKKQHAVGVTESLVTSAGYILLGLLFGGWIAWQMGTQAGIDYLTGFVVEKTLALDNIFVISLIFSYFAIPRHYQHKVLFWGILGVLLLRGLMIGLGAALVSSFGWVLYIFGAFLILTGVKMLFTNSHDKDIGNNAMIRFMRRYMRVTDEYHGSRFFVQKLDANTGKRAKYATPLFLALVMVEFADLVFAVDSVPAIFAITTDPYIVYTSNIFAILGLRALYFALAAMMHRFVYLKYALSAVLIFIGGKIYWHHLVGKVDPVLSLAITLGLLAAGILISLMKTRRDELKSSA